MENRPISCIRCGDIFLANFDLISGKRKGIKSALVIQKETIGKSGLAILSAPLIPVSDAYPQGANIILEKGDGLKWRTLVCIGEVCVLDRRRFGRYIGHVGKDKRCSLSEVRCMNGPASMGHMPVTARNRLPGTGDLKIWNFVSVRSVLLHSSIHRGISSDRKTSADMHRHLYDVPGAPGIRLYYHRKEMEVSKCTIAEATLSPYG